MSFGHLLNARLALWTGAFLLAAFGVGNVFVALFSQARYEVIYQFSVSVSYCAGEQCGYSATLEVANSGRKMQDEVSLIIEGVPPQVGGTPHTINLDASMPRQGDPQIEQLREGDRLSIRLQKLGPGALTRFRFYGWMSQAELAAAQNPRLEIRARGRIIEGDPRSIAFGRWFTSLGHEPPLAI